MSKGDDICGDKVKDVLDAVNIDLDYLTKKGIVNEIVNFDSKY